MSVKNFFSSYGLRANAEPVLGLIGSADFRSSFTFKIEQLDPNFLKNRNMVLVNLNLRYESPLLNVQIRLHQQDHNLEVLLVGYLSNTNFDFIHVGAHAHLTAFLRFHEKNLDTVVIVGGQHQAPSYYAFVEEQSNFVWTKISQLTCLEIMPLSNTRVKSIFSANVGVLWPDVPVLTNYAEASVNFLHHMVDEYKAFARVGVFWPTKFYLEKVASFIGNVGHFFSTVINIFGFNIRGTKEEHKILQAFDELLEDKLEPIDFEKINFARLSMNEKPTSILSSTQTQYLTLHYAPVTSVINDYYLTNEICQISPVLGLCSKRYGVMNDYLWVSPVLNKC